MVTGQRAQQERSKRDAIGVVDVAAADEIGRLPDRNVAEVVERLPGIGVTYDQGEGRLVAIRGVPSALNGYTLNGIEIGNPDGETRALPLDVVSGQPLNRVEVAKSIPPTWMASASFRASPTSSTPTPATPAAATSTARFPGPSIVPNAAMTRANAVLNDFTLSERVVAGYASANLKFGGVTATPGVRYGNKRLDITASSSATARRPPLCRAPIATTIGCRR